MPRARSRSLKWRKSNEIARARRTTSREGVDIETRPFSFTPRGKCTRATSHDSFLTNRDNRPDYSSSATDGYMRGVMRDVNPFFFSFFMHIQALPTRKRLLFTILQRRVYCGLLRARVQRSSSARDILTRHHGRNRFHTIYNFISTHFAYSKRE